MMESYESSAVKTAKNFSSALLSMLILHRKQKFQNQIICSLADILSLVNLWYSFG